MGDGRNETSDGSVVINRILTSKMNGDIQSYNPRKCNNICHIISGVYLSAPNHLTIPAADSKTSSSMFKCLNFNVTRLAASADPQAAPYPT